MIKTQNNNKILKISLSASLAGFLFGFDTVVISGADQTLQSLWNTSDLFHGTFIMSMALWGTVFGAIFANVPCDKIGRKNTLFWIGILYFVSALGSGLANDPYVFSFFRFIGGLGVGASTVAAPTYISEIAPSNKRGQLVAMYQFNIVFGILIAFTSNYLLQDFGNEPWRWMLGVEVLPAFLYVLMILSVPKSIRWLITKRHAVEKAKAEYLKYFGTPLPDALISEIKKQDDKSMGSLLSKKYRFPLILAFFIAFFNQLSGINAFLYYAPRIFQSAGLEESASLLSGIGIGVTNLLFTLIGLYLIDKMGRRKLMYIGSFGYIFSLIFIALSFFLNWQGILLPFFLFLFIASHAVGQGAVIWVFIAEIFPNKLRAKGQSFGTSIHWILAAVITLFMPRVLNLFENPGVVFLFFAFMMVLQLFFVIFMMPETKGVSLEDMEHKLKH